MSNPGRIDELLDSIVTLPSLPTTVENILTQLNEPDCSLAEVGKAIAFDPALALKTLRLVNSAFAGVRQQVTAVEHAVTLLGAKVIKNMIVSATVFETFQKGAGQLLRHSVACGTAMRVLADQSPEKTHIASDDAFICGLLHDIGMIIYEEFLPKEFDNALQMARSRQIPLYEAEQEIIGADHAEMGARLVQKWKLSEELSGAIAGHHDTSRCSTPDVQRRAAMLGIADHLCTYLGLSSMPRAIACPQPEVWEIAKLPNEDIPAYLDGFITELPAIDELLSLAN